MLRFAGVSTSPRPLVTSGTMFAQPFVPVEVSVPAASRRNQVSMVNDEAPSAVVGPNVTYWLEPLKLSAPCARAAGTCEPSNATLKRAHAIDRRSARRVKCEPGERKEERSALIREMRTTTSVERMKSRSPRGGRDR